MKQKIINLRLRWYILRSYLVVAEVTFNAQNFGTLMLQKVVTNGTVLKLCKGRGLLF